MKLNPILRIYSFFLGFGWVIDVAIIGRFSLREILLYLALPFLLVTNKAVRWNKTLIYYFSFIGIFAAAVVVSDIVNDNYFDLFLRGFARPLAIGLNTLSFVLLITRSPRLLIYFAAGMVPGACVGYFQESQFNELGFEGGYKHFNAKVEPILRACAIVTGIFFLRWTPIFGRPDKV
jgi:hypothetical protein